MSQGRSAERTPTIVAAAGVFILGLAGGLVTDIGPWYASLAKPSWQPPDWLFGPVWTIIFVLMATAGVLVWRTVRRTSRRNFFLAAFGLNAILNVAWSALFFRAHRPDWAMIEAVFLWLSVVLLIVMVRPGPRLAPWLLTPYLVWVAFACFLNYTIVTLN